MVNSGASDTNQEGDAKEVVKTHLKITDNQVTHVPIKIVRPIEYKFDEANICNEILKFINATYSGHYSGERGQRIQVTEFSLSHCENPEDALRFNVLKYAARYGKKKGWNKEDLLKSAHYLVMMIYYHNMYLSKEGQ